MKLTRTFTSASVLALLAGPAFADLTAEQVWNDWKELLGNYGATLSADESSSGSTLTVSGATAKFDIPDGSITVEMGEMRFSELGDGSVAIEMADSIPMNVTGMDEEAGEVTVSLSVLQPNATMTASGDNENLRYDFEYPSMSLSDFTIQGDEIPSEFPLNVDFLMSQMSGFMTLSGDDIRSFESQSSIEALTMAIQAADPEGSGMFDFSFEMANLDQVTSGTIGKMEMDMSAAEMIKGGMTQKGIASYGAASYGMAADGPDGAFQMEASAGSGNLNFSMDENGITYGGSSKDNQVSISGDMIPLPSVNLRFAENTGQLSIPLVPGEDPQDFGMVVKLVGLEIDDMIWGLFDPAGQLPRDPATLIVDVTGKGVLTEDFTDPEFAENPAAMAPGTLEEVSVNQIQLTLAGAELTGDGDFEFDNSLGIPMPSGLANLKLVGGNGLLDTLVGMGLVPEEQAMGARMMLGLFARPGDGPDTLVSTIEMKEDGSILANGQRIK